MHYKCAPATPGEVFKCIKNFLQQLRDNMFKCIKNVLQQLQDDMFKYFKNALQQLHDEGSNALRMGYKHHSVENES